jgi:hypothetical protein
MTPLLFLLLCANKKPVRDDNFDSQELTDAAGEYWRALRWGDAPRAKSFLERADVKLAFDEWFHDEGKDHKITDATILTVTLQPKPEVPTGTHVRDATVTVRKEGYSVNDLSVREETVEQKWYRTETGWFVVWP